MLANLLIGGQTTKISSPAAPGSLRRKQGNYLGGRRAKKRASVLSTKAEKSREVLRSSIYEIVLFVVLISALYVQESDGIVVLYLIIITTIYSSSSNNNM